MHPHNTIVFISLLYALVCTSCADNTDAPNTDSETEGTDPDDAGDGMDAGDDTETETESDIEICPEPDVCEDATYTGVTWQCQQRFMYGINYAWRHFGADFGGVPSDEPSGISEARDEYMVDLTEMKARGVNVIRWWMFPAFRTDSILYDENHMITGIGGSLEADILAALEMAHELDLYLMLTLFSFDGFRPDEETEDSFIPSLSPMVLDDDKRAAVIDNLVRPTAAVVEASPYRDHMIAWDVINEPEWAVRGYGVNGDQNFDPTDGLESVLYDDMHAFLDEVIAGLRTESSALVTIGAAAFKWAHAWQDLDQDFYQFHMYSWVNDYWPYTDPPEAYDLTDKPTVMGEYFLGYMDPGDTSTPSFAEMTESFYNNGYAGALGWQYINVAGGWTLPEYMDPVEAFAEAHTCETAYSIPDGDTTDAAAASKRRLPLLPRSPEPYLGRICRIGLDGRPDCTER